MKKTPHVFPVRRTDTITRGNVVAACSVVVPVQADTKYETARKVCRWIMRYEPSKRHIERALSYL